MSGSIVFAGIAPHPPLLVPEVGHHYLSQVTESQRALREFSRRLVANEPDCIVVISPHSPLDDDAFAVRTSPTLAGDFGRFGARDASLSFPNCPEMIDAVEAAAESERVSILRLKDSVDLDHGALVPLYYLSEAGWTGPVVVFGFSEASNRVHLSFGRVLNNAVRSLGRRAALVASADLSHRLTLDGPYKYEPTAHLFDEQVVRAISTGDVDEIVGIDHKLRVRAGECGYRSILVALGAVEGRPLRQQVLSYEGPLGVGYMVAVLVDSSSGFEGDERN